MTPAELYQLRITDILRHGGLIAGVASSLAYYRQQLEADLQAGGELETMMPTYQATVARTVTHPTLGTFDILDILDKLQEVAEMARFYDENGLNGPGTVFGIWTPE